MAGYLFCKAGVFESWSLHVLVIDYMLFELAIYFVQHFDQMVGAGLFHQNAGQNGDVVGTILWMTM